MKKQLTVLLFAITLLCSCTKDTKTIKIKMDKVDGLTTEALVILNGVEIGNINDISFDKDNKILIELILENKPQLPKDTEFKIKSLDFLGTKGISVKLGKSSEMLNNGETVTGITESTIIQTDSVKAKLKDIFHEITGTYQQDSILIELRKLSDRLDKLEKEN